MIKMLLEKQKKIILSLFFLLIFISASTADEIKGFSKVIDGDTVHINDNKIRLHGIDAPEKRQTCIKFGQEYNCGTESTEALLKKIEKKPIICKVELNKDRYGRFIGVCFVEEINLNKWMVRNGHAVAYRRYSKEYIQDEEYAKKEKIGLWSGTFLEPEKWRKLN
jgi:endonuclease YncB( thermonuclease family)